MCTRWPDLTESPESAILPVVNEMKIDALALITVVIAAIIYVVVMMMGLFDAFPFGLIGLVLPFILGYLFYRVFQIDPDEAEDDQAEHAEPNGTAR